MAIRNWGDIATKKVYSSHIKTRNIESDSFK